MTTTHHQRIESSLRAEEVDILDDLAAEEFNTSRAGFVRGAVRYAMENPEELRAWLEHVRSSHP